MKPIMHLYSDKVTITDREELMPLMKGSTIHVAASEKSGMIYANVSKEDLNEFISENIGIQPDLMLLKLVVEIAPEVKTVPSLRIINDTVSIEETLKADVLMINEAKALLVVGVEGKIYTNDVKCAKECIQMDADNGEFSACLLQSIISKSGLTECEPQVEK